MDCDQTSPLRIVSYDVTVGAVNGGLIGPDRCGGIIGGGVVSLSNDSSGVLLGGGFGGDVLATLLMPTFS